MATVVLGSHLVDADLPTRGRLVPERGDMSDKPKGAWIIDTSPEARAKYWEGRFDEEHAYRLALQRELHELKKEIENRDLDDKAAESYREYREAKDREAKDG